MDETEVELNKFVNLEFDNTGVFAVFVDIRDVATANTVATMELPLELDFLTSFKCQAPIIENRLIEFYGEDKSFKIMTDIQNYLAANFASEV